METMAQQAALAQVKQLINELDVWREMEDAEVVNWRRVKCIKGIQDIFEKYFGIECGRLIPDGKLKDLAMMVYNKLMEREEYTLAAFFAKDYGL